MTKQEVDWDLESIEDTYRKQLMVNRKGGLEYL